MGSSADAILTYGIALGGEEDGWKIQGVDRWDEWRPSWLKPSEDNPEEYADSNYIACAMEALLAAAGFTEAAWEADGYLERREQAELRMGVSFVTHGHYNFKQLILTTFSIGANQTQARGLSLAALASMPTQTWDGQIQDALDVLGIKPVQERPTWLLTASYG